MIKRKPLGVANWKMAMTVAESLAFLRRFQAAIGSLAQAVRRTYRQLFIPARDGLKELDLGIPTYGEERPLDEEVYEKLRLEGEILERIVPLVTKERYLRDQEHVLTNTVRIKVGRSAL